MKIAEKREFENEEGGLIPLEKIRCVSTYKYSSDGFFEWECTVCNMEQRFRAHKINGVVFKCRNCRNEILLLRSDVDYQHDLVVLAKQFGELVEHIEKCDDCGSKKRVMVCDKHLDILLEKMQEVVNIERTPPK